MLIAFVIVFYESVFERKYVGDRQVVATAEIQDTTKF